MKSYDGIITALLHDVVEDSDITIEDLEKEFPRNITEALKLLTHEIGTDYFTYIRNLKDNELNDPPKMVHRSTMHVNKERNHNVTLGEAKSFIKNARFSETVWKGQFERYYSKDGVAYVNNYNLQVRTAFKNDEVIGVTEQALEIIKKYE